MPSSSSSDEAGMRGRDREKREVTRRTSPNRDRSPVKREANQRQHRKRERKSSSDEETSWEEEQRLYNSHRIKEEAEDAGYDIKIKEEPLDRVDIKPRTSGGAIIDERHRNKSRGHRHADDDKLQRQEKHRGHHNNDDANFRRPEAPSRGRQQDNGSRDVRSSDSHNVGYDRRNDRDNDRDTHRNRDEEGDIHREGERQTHGDRNRERYEGSNTRGDRDRQERIGNRQDRRDGQSDRDRRNLVEQRRERYQNDRQRLERRAERGVDNERGVNEVWGGGNSEASSSAEAPGEKKEKEKPTLELSGKLADDTNVFRGVVIKYSEPEEARKPKKHWRFHPFKGDEALPILHLHRQSAFLLGRDRKIADIPVDHPSCSKQHAVLQFRLVGYKKSDGTTGRRVSPYIIDLGSANGTYVNNQRIEAQRYVELLEKDVIKFGFSSRDYVLLHDSSDTSEITGDDEGEA